jgi:hypothetical protein
MATMTNLLVKDDAATPIELTFYPITDTPNPFWRCSINGVPIDGQPRLTQSIEKQKNGQWKISVKLEVPAMETLGTSGTSYGYVAPPKVAYATPIILTMFANARSTKADRLNTLKLMIGLVQGATATTATGFLSQASAGGAFSGSTAPFVQLFGDLILAS